MELGKWSAASYQACRIRREIPLEQVISYGIYLLPSPISLVHEVCLIFSVSLRSFLFILI